MEFPDFLKCFCYVYVPDVWELGGIILSGPVTPPTKQSEEEKSLITKRTTP